MKKVRAVINPQRFFATAVRYSKYGRPSEVLKLEKIDLGSIGPKDVAMKFLAAPINPADINMVEGVYGIKPTFPAIGGSEGVAVVTATGNEVTSLKEGDWVIPVGLGFGTWRDEAIAAESALQKVANDIPAPYAGTMVVNPATAYRMLRDFQKLKPGDVLIQNCANSVVGMAVIQMARDMGVKTINIIRKERPSADNVLRLLTNLGGDINIKDDYFCSPEFHEILAELPPCKLAFNGAGGQNVTEMARVLAPNGTIVTYGGMSKKPIQIPYDLLTSKQLKLRGFWMSQWYQTHSFSERAEMLDEITNMIREKKLTFFYEVHDLDDFDFALERSNESFQLRKIILNGSYPDRLAEHDKLDAKAYEHFQYPVV